VFKC